MKGGDRKFNGKPAISRKR